MKAYIYKITNNLNTKVYVGQTWKTIDERFKRHCAEARWRNTKKMPIVFAIKKYGESHFQISILEELDDPTQLQLDAQEVFWVDKLNTFSPNGYNLKAGQASGKASEETKKKIGLANKGKKRSEETKERLRISHLGYKVTDQTKVKLSLFNKGKTLSLEHCQKIANSNKGGKRTDECKEKMRQKKLKYHYTIQAPDGAIFETKNLEQFSREHELNSSHMNSVSLGKIAHYKQWRILNRICLDAHLTII